jgi:hypothetical protein
VPAQEPLPQVSLPPPPPQVPQSATQTSQPSVQAPSPHTAGQEPASWGQELHDSPASMVPLPQAAAVEVPEQSYLVASQPGEQQVVQTVSEHSVIVSPGVSLQMGSYTGSQ